MTTNYLEALLDRVATLDPVLASDLRAQVRTRLGGRELGLVFDKHVPETVELPGRRVRSRDKVRIRPDGDAATWIVSRIRRDKKVGRIADVVSASDPELVREVLISDLIVIADFRDPIYPGLRSTGRIERGGDKPFHAVIKAENFHALEALRFAYQGRVDCIYIDPPYNTRANDWKYNNNYVDPDDRYAPSMWLSFMERRLKVAKQLLNPDDSALIVTIDEKEHLRLGLLLEQAFPEGTMQMVSTVINPKGTGRAGFRRVDEYVFFVWFGAARLGRLAQSSSIDDVPDEDNVDEPDPATHASRSCGSEAVSHAEDEAEPEPVVGLDWQTFRRRDLASARGTTKGGPRQFYPIYVNRKSGHIEAIGEPLKHDVPRTKAPARRGCVAVFPIREDGTEMNWAVTVPTAKERWEAGYLRAGKAEPKKPQPYIIQYLKKGPIDDINEGRAVVDGFADDGSVIAHYANAKATGPTTQWRFPSHSAEHYGYKLLKRFVPGREFPFPKSLYAVEDALRLFVATKRNAIILDFFGGSGTTAHAVMRLNRQDEGRRQCVLVTNNEVSVKEAKALRNSGARPGDSEWEALGICEHITRPRIEAAVTGRTYKNVAVVGDYKFTDESPMAEGFDENVEFFDLTYEDAERIRLDMAFEAVAPLLWLRAGAVGSRIETRSGTFAVADEYAILFNPDCWRQFTEAIGTADDMSCVFIVTDSDSVYEAVSSALPTVVDKVRLYESYLQSFEINTGEG